MKVIILGVCGSLMSGVAVLAKALGYEVIGYDRVVNDPAKSVLESHSIRVHQEMPSSIKLKDGDQVIIGNQMTRKMPVISAIISQRVRMYSAPEWLNQYVLRGRKVIAVAGCHGKTTTTAMIAHMLHTVGEDCGYLIAGNPQSKYGPAYLGTSEYFVIEADEYDTAFFDKRPKFMHYWPTHLVLGAIEFDHADIYGSYKELLAQYKLLLRLLPDGGTVVHEKLPAALHDLIASYGLVGIEPQALADRVLHVRGQFNALNAARAAEIGAILGYNRAELWEALASFKAVKRRFEKVFDEDVTIIDDHAHHPSAVRETLSILENERVHLLYYPKTHTQRLDIHHKDTLEVLSVPYAAYMLLPDNHMLNTTAYQNAGIQLGDTSLIVKALLQKVKKKDVILICTPYYLCDIVKQLKNGLRKKGCIVG